MRSEPGILHPRLHSWNIHTLLSALCKVLTGLQSVGLQSVGLQSVGLQSVGLQSAGLQSVSLQSVGLQSLGLQSVGLQSAGLQSAQLITLTTFQGGDRQHSPAGVQRGLRPLGSPGGESRGK